jgi:PAS domain S-box-containing protein
MGSIEKYSEDEFKKLSHHLPDLIFQFTRRPDGSYYVPIASKGIENIFGCTPEDVKDSFDPIAKVIHPEDLHIVIEKIELSALQLEEFEVEYRTCIPGRPLQWIFTRSTPEKLSDGSITWFGFSANITSQRNSQEQLEALSKKQEAILKAIPDLIFEVDFNGVIQQFHSQMNDLLAATPEEFLGKKMSEFIPKQAEDIIKLALVEANEKGFSVGYQYELPLPQGNYWFELSVAPIKQNNITVNHFIILARNITERKQIDDKLMQLLHAVEQSSTSIVISNLDGELEYVNKYFLNLTGYTYEEVIGANPRILQSGYTKKEDYTAMWNTIKSGKTWHGEFLNKKKDGSLYWEEVTISPVRNEKGEIKHFLGIKTDITKQKKTAEKLRKIVWNQSHQVRGPLTDILGILKLIKLDITIEEKTSLLEHLEKAAQELDQTIHHVIDETRKPI